MTALGTAVPTDTAPRPSPGLLLASQLVFNIGFYAVVPFLALVMTRQVLVQESLQVRTRHLSCAAPCLGLLLQMPSEEGMDVHDHVALRREQRLLVAGLLAIEERLQVCPVQVSSLLRKQAAPV